MGLCENCKHYHPHTNGLGQCHRWHGGDGSFGYSWTSEEIGERGVVVETDEGWGAFMGPKFGCVLHESRPANVEVETPTDNFSHVMSGVSGAAWTLASPTPAHVAFMSADRSELVRISMHDGSITYGPNYSPDAVAKQFWQAISDEYRRMLAWKAEHPEVR